MAFDITKLVCFAQGATVGTTGRRAQLHHYVTSDAESIVAADSYFGAAGLLMSDKVAAGDMIFATCGIGGTVTSVICTVTSAAGAAVATEENT